MKKVLFVIHDANPLSGATASMLDIIFSLYKSNSAYVPHLLIPKSKCKKLELLLRDRAINYQVSEVPMTRYENNSSILIRFLKCSKAFISILKCFFLSFIINKNSDFDLIYNNTSATYLGITLRLISRKPLISHIREFGIEDQNMKQVFGEKFYYRLVYTFSEEIVCISLSLKEHLENYIRSDKLTLIYDDVFVKGNSFDISYHFSNELKFLVTGTVCKGKGQKFVIEALKKARDELGLDIQLILAGNYDSNYGKALYKEVNSRNMSSWVSFLGVQEDMSEVRKDCHIAIVASTKEAFGRITIEAMQSGLLVIGSKAGANTELITDKETGLFFEKNNERDLIKQLNLLTEPAFLSEVYKIREQAYKFSSNFCQGKGSKNIHKLIINVMAQD